MPDPEADGPGAAEPDLPRWPRYAIALAVLAVVVLVTAWAAGLQTSAPGDGSTDAVRLGPDSGESVAGYLARVRDVPPGPGPRLALVQFTEPRDAVGAAATLRPARAAGVQAVFRVPLPRVQTAVRRLSLTSAEPAAAVLAAETQAGVAARQQATTSTGRAAAVAAAEAAALGGRCACVLALVVRLDPGTVPALAAAPGVRAVQVAPPGASPEALAVSPLLPEQTDVVGPVPDDGAAPPTP